MPTTPPALIAVPDTLDFGNPPATPAPSGPSAKATPPDRTVSRPSSTPAISTSS